MTEEGPEIAALDEFVENNTDKAEDWLDYSYCVEQIGAVPDMVRRTFQFSALGAITIPSEQTQHYIREASRSYIHGLFLSSVAMARCALEHALKEGLRRSGVVRFDGESLQRKSALGLIEVARNMNIVLPSDMIEDAKKWARNCNEAMHLRPERSERKVFEILLGIRFLLKEIYSPASRRQP